jgi:hypothetical protein
MIAWPSNVTTYADVPISQPVGAADGVLGKLPTGASVVQRVGNAAAPASVDEREVVGYLLVQCGEFALEEGRGPDDVRLQCGPLDRYSLDARNLRY